MGNGLDTVESRLDELSARLDHIAAPDVAMSDVRTSEFGTSDVKLSGTGGDGFEDLVVLVNDFNRSVGTLGEHDEQEPAVKGRIARLVRKFGEVAGKVATATNAHGFSISVGIPFGVTISFDWERDT